MGTAEPLVLLVDDSADSRGMYAEYLASEGFRVLEAADGERAVEIARHERPDALVIDVVLPGIDGLEATRMVREDPATTAIVIVVLSGRAEPDVRRRAKDAGVDRFVTKPCLPDVLAELLRGLLGARGSV